MPRRTVPHPFVARVGARVRQLRDERNMSLAEVATASSISKGNLSRIEHGLTGMTLGTVERLAKALELSPLYVYAFPEDDEFVKIAELIRRLPPSYLEKLQQLLIKMVNAERRGRSKRSRI
jgi:transcriptional regulator with XRE-family HTH domain